MSKVDTTPNNSEGNVDPNSEGNSNSNVDPNAGTNPKGDGEGVGDGGEESPELKEVREQLEAAQRELERFKGLDPEAARKAIESAKEAEAARKKAEADRKKAEREAAAQAGNVEALRKSFEEEYSAKMAELEEKLNEAIQRASDLENGIKSAKYDTEFAQSKFVTENLVISPVKAKVLFGDYFDYVDGELVAFNKPRGAPGRIELTDTRGKKLGFNDAIEKIVKEDPDADKLIVSKLRSGAGSKTTDKTVKEQKVLSSREKVAMGLKELQK